MDESGFKLSFCNSGLIDSGLFDSGLFNSDFFNAGPFIPRLRNALNPTESADVSIPLPLVGVKMKEFAT
ncbi:MAG: hypothetical protein ABSG72_06615 [Candidatus Sulfotelmatobacter sp.]